MKASELEARLQELRKLHGDFEVMVDCVDPLFLVPIDEVDVDPEQDRIVIWPGDSRVKTEGRPGYVCVCCGDEPVDPEAGFDTCPSCAART